MPTPRRPRRNSDRNRRVRTPDIPTPEMIETADGVDDLAERLQDAREIAFDTEFLRERTYFPQLGLIQIADDRKAWLVDPLALSERDMDPLLDIFTDPKILKIAHSAEQDQECLAHDYGITARPLFDTSIGAALTGKGDQIGLAPLLRKMVGVDLPKGHTRTNWLKRPLQEAMAEYAALDVYYLVDVGRQLLRDLEKRGRKDWAMGLSAELAAPERYKTNGAGPARKLAAGSRLSPREYAVLKELSAWREERVRKSDIPRRWLAEDSTLMQLTRAQPKDVAHLADFRGLGGRVRDFGGEKILDAISRGLKVPEAELEEPPQKPEPTPKETAALVVFKSFLTFLARENDVPLRYLMDGETPLHLLRGEFKSLDDLRDSGLLDDGAIEVLGEEMLAILSGRRALKIERGAAVSFEP